MGKRKTATRGRRKVASATVLKAASQLEHVAWPGLGTPVANTVMALYYQFQQSEWWSPEQLALQQARQLDALLEYAARTPYYAPLLRQLGYPSATRSAMDLWPEIPVLQRATVAADSVAFHNRDLPEGLGPLAGSTTAGTSAAALNVARPRLLQFYQQAAMLREHLWHRRDPSARYAHLRAFESLPQAQTLPGATAPAWPSLHGLVETTGSSFALDLRLPIDAQIEWLDSIGPHYLVTHASNLKALLARARTSNRRLGASTLRQVCTVQERIDDDLREMLRLRPELSLADEYSAQEVGVIAQQCPDYPVYHCVSELVKVEVLDAADRPCAAGEIGRVVVTALHNLAMPLLRYDLGDLAEVGGSCPCGRGLPVLRRLLGRATDTLHYPDGRQQRCPEGDLGYRAIAPIEHYSIEQRSPQRLDVHAITRRLPSAEQARAFTHWLQGHLGHPFEINLHYSAEMQRGAGYRCERFRNRILA